MRSARFWLLLALLMAVSPVLRSGEPMIRDVAPRGLQIGGTTTLVVQGEELGTAPRLLLPFAARQQLKPGSTKNQATFDVTLEPGIEAGYYQLWVVNDEGVSLPVAVAVDRLPQRPIGATLTAGTQLPIAAHGSVGGGAVIETRFVGKAGQKVQIEVEAQRLGSKLRPVVHLVDARNVQVGWAWPTPALHGDARLQAVLPADGTYAIAIHDAEYAVPVPGFFRLRVGLWSFADRVFPPAVQQGRAQAVEMLGVAPLSRVNLPAAGHAGALPVPLSKDDVWSGPRPFVLVSSHPEVVRQAEPGKVQELPAGLVGVSGRLTMPHGEDRYRVPVPPGTKTLRLEVFAERLGSPLDAALVVRNEQGGELGRAEDGPGTLDPILEYAVPANTSAVLVDVVDSQGRGGPGAVYRLVVDPQGSGMDRHSIRLHTAVGRVALPIGGRAVVPVIVERQGYQQRIELSAEDLPTGMRLEGANIPEGADGALVTVQRGSAGPGAAITHWSGERRGVSPPETGHAGERRGVSPPVFVKGHPLEQLQPWLATEIAVATSSAKSGDFQVDWRGLPADAGPVLGGKLPLPVKMTRPAGNNLVRLTLLTSQPQPMLNGQPDLTQTIRLEKPIELPAGAADGDLVVLVPAQLTAPVYDFSVQAELLTPDRRTVLATTYAPVRRLTVRNPLVVRLEGPPRRDTVVDPKTGAVVNLQGQVERREGLAGDVTLMLSGLPNGARADAVIVKPDVKTFALKVVLPPGTMAGELTGLKLFATALPDPKQPNVRIRSRDLDVTLVVRPPAK